MHRQVGPLRTGPDGLARRGLLVRHLVMPGVARESEEILAFLAREVSPDTWVNVMGQYRPQWRVGEPDDEGHRLFPEIDRPSREREVEAAREAARRAGLWRLDARAGGRA
jgi:putative pyruvate formate lyase activating enzyme